MMLIKHLIRNPKNCFLSMQTIFCQEKIWRNSSLKNFKLQIYPYSKVRAINDEDPLHIGNCYQQFLVYLTIRSVFHFPEAPNLFNVTRWNLLQFNPKHWLHDKFFSEQTVSKKEKSTPKEELEENWGGPEAYRLIIFLKEDINEILKKHEEVLVFYSASWCKHCLRLRKPFGQAAVMAKQADLPAKFATFDVDINHNIADEKGVVGVPLLKFYKKGQFVSNYKGKRTAEDLFQFVKSPPKSNTEPKNADV